MCADYASWSVVPHVVVATLRRHDCTVSRVGDDPRPRQGTQAVADRRDVPHVVVALRLRPGLPGRAHRTCSRARTGLLLLWRARVGEEGEGAGREAGPP